MIFISNYCRSKTVEDNFDDVNYKPLVCWTMYRYRTTKCPWAQDLCMYGAKQSWLQCGRHSISFPLCRCRSRLAAASVWSVGVAVTCCGLACLQHSVLSANMIVIITVHVSFSIPCIIIIRLSRGLLNGYKHTHAHARARAHTHG